MPRQPQQGTNGLRRGTLLARLNTRPTRTTTAEPSTDRYRVLVKQDKATIKAPLDPDYYIVTEVRVTKITGERRGETKTRNVEKWKLYKERPAYLNITEPPKVGEEMEPESDSDFECELRSEHGPQDRREQHRATSGGEEAHPPMDPAVPVQAAAKSRQVIRESWVVAAGPW